MVKLPIHLQSWLKDQAEYGRGYQYGTVKLSTGSIVRGFILNGATFAAPDELKTMSPIDLAKAEAAAHMSSYSITEVMVANNRLHSYRESVELAFF